MKMNPVNAVRETLDAENDLIQWIVEEGVRAGMDSPLRESILEAVEGTLDDPDVVMETEPDDVVSAESTVEGIGGASETRRITTIFQGLTVFVVTFVVLYLSLRRLLGDDET